MIKIYGRVRGEVRKRGNEGEGGWFDPWLGGLVPSHLSERGSIAVAVVQ